MTEHLPECPQGYAVPFTLDRCNCNELRAREEQSGGLITRQRAEQIGRNIGKYGCVITEQQHLPECEAYRDECGGGCICHHVRACERRVRTVRDSIVFGKGYSAALKAVQEAVAAWPEYRMRDACAAAIDAVREAER